MGIDATRREMLATRAADNQAVLLYANAVGGQDGLIYDGGGFIFQNGRLRARRAAVRARAGGRRSSISIARGRLRLENTTWRTDCEEFRLQRRDRAAISATADGGSLARWPTRRPRAAASSCRPAGAPDSIRATCALDDLFEALALGVKSYYEKTGAFRSLGIALSGGRDSMLTLLVAWRAAQLIERRRTRIAAFYMPSRHSQDDDHARRPTCSPKSSASSCRSSRSTRRPIARSRPPRACSAVQAPTELTRQNVQARLRGQRMWNWANSSGALFLQTGDMSEKAVGYTTIGGDLEGALSVIANVPKTVVIALLERLRRASAFQGIAATLATEPGPELADDQVGRDAS